MKSDSDIRNALIRFGRLNLKDDTALKYLDERIKTLPKNEIKKMHAVLKGYEMTKSETTKETLTKYIQLSFSLKRWLRTKIENEALAR